MGILSFIGHLWFQMARETLSSGSHTIPSAMKEINQDRVSLFSTDFLTDP